MLDSEARPADRTGWTLRPMMIGAGHLAIIAVLLHSVSWLAVHPAVYTVLNARQLNQAEGYQLASALAAFRTAAPPRVLIIGASTAQQGFDAERISREAQPYTVVNAATGGGTLFCPELLLRGVQRQDLHPDIIVLSLSAMELCDQALWISDAGYTNLFDLRDMDLAEMDGPEENVSRVKKQLLINTLFPAARHRWVVSRYWRLMVYEIQAAYKSMPLDLERFRVNASDLREPLTFPAKRVAPDLQWRAKQWKIWEECRRLDPTFVGQPRHFAQLDRILAAATEHAQRVVVVLIPHHSRAREHADALAQQPLLDHLEQWRDRCTVLDWSTMLDDDDFFDYVHPTAQGRTKVSSAMISLLRSQNPP